MRGQRGLRGAAGVISLVGLVAALARTGGAGPRASGAGARTVALGMAPPAEDASSLRADALGWGLLDEQGAGDDDEDACEEPGAEGADEAGRAAFDTACGRCHPDGEADAGPSLMGLNWPAARVRALVRRGRREMPPTPPARLSEQRLDEVIAYLRTLRAVR